MQKLNGYIKVYRKLIRWGWYQDSVVKDLFLHFLLTASFKDFEWMGRHLKAGQLVTGRKKLAAELGFSEQQIRTGIKKLESTKEITSETTNKYSIITVVNWEDYQSDENISTNTITNEQPTSNQQITNEQPHRKNIKNNKNVKNSNKRACAHEIPLFSQISDFVKEKGLNVDVDKFFKYYSERDWLTAEGKSIDDWKSVVESWHRKELKPAPIYPNGYAGVKNLADD